NKQSLGGSDGCAEGGTSDSTTTPDFVFSSTGRVSFSGLAAVNFVDVAAFLDFATVFVGFGLNAVFFEWISLVAAVLEKQLCEVHTCCGGIGQLQPNKIAHSAPTRSTLINTFPPVRDHLVL